MSSTAAASANLSNNPLDISSRGICDTSARAASSCRIERRTRPGPKPRADTTAAVAVAVAAAPPPAVFVAPNPHADTAGAAIAAAGGAGGAGGDAELKPRVERKEKMFVSLSSVSLTLVEREGDVRRGG